MPEYDLVIRNGTVIDGTGVPRYKADVAIENQRIVNIGGRITGRGAKEIDATGCVVAPGAIDLHTHYDGQLNWDPYCTPSGWFGVTSLTIGQCGFGFAPTRPEDRDLNMQMMNRVEAIPLESMRQGMRWDWETFPQYLDSLDHQGLGLNVGALMPFSCLRSYVLGMKPARDRTSVNKDELEEMKRLFREGMQAGAFGIAGNRSAEDHPEDGGYLPSHVASDEEWLALAEVLGEFDVGHIGWDIGNVPMFDDRPQQHALLEKMVETSGRPLHLILGAPESAEWMQQARAKGLPIVEQIQTTVAESTFKLAEYNMYDIMPNWVQPMVGSAEERIPKLQDPANRVAMKADIEKLKRERHLSINPELSRTNWDMVRVYEVVYDRNQEYEGRTINEVATSMSKDPVDAFLDLALDEHLQTVFTVPQNPGDSPDLIDRITGPYGHISMSDGGAHTRYQTSAHWPIYFLAHWVRDKEVMTLEQAHYKMSALPAWLASFKDRGRLTIGSWADIMVYDLDKLGMLFDGPTWADDFPGGERRFIRKPTGLNYTIVNGTVTFEGNDCTGALPGVLLRSYDMVG